MITIVFTLLASACSSEAGTSTTSAPSTTTTSVVTTTTAATTTTTIGPMEVLGAESDPPLEELIREMYEPDEGDEDNLPITAEAFIGRFDARARVAVIEVGEDITLAIADPHWRVVGGWWPSLGEAPSLGAFPKTVAVVGSDARPGHDPLSSQADSIHFLVLGDTGTASILGLPRDSWIPVPDLGNQKATSSLLRGGPEAMMGAFSDLTGLDFDGYLLTGFEGFTGLIEVLGGLDIEVPLDLNDRWSKAYLDAGRQILSAADTLAFARTRKTISGGDFTRQEHGGLVLIAAANTVQAMGIRAVPGLMEQARDLYHTDLSAEEMILLAGAIIRADLAQVTNEVAPGYVDTTSGGASIVRLRDEAYDLFQDLADGRLGN